MAGMRDANEANNAANQPPLEAPRPTVGDEDTYRPEEVQPTGQAFFSLPPENLGFKPGSRYRRDIPAGLEVDLDSDGQLETIGTPVGKLYIKVEDKNDAYVGAYQDYESNYRITRWINVAIDEDGNILPEDNGNPKVAGNGEDGELKQYGIRIEDFYKSVATGLNDGWGKAFLKHGHIFRENNEGPIVAETLPKPPNVEEIKTKIATVKRRIAGAAVIGGVVVQLIRHVATEVVIKAVLSSAGLAGAT
ncbi:hypothetical protein [Calycomorphotria hydatis]|uniref:Uncharacterized protein n=1 Tax=Calycomorphotria hydatis TaxID=2528027 RepID=A0A517TA48_9PLAN|nr:hypothetical protein [Calycomorphotria hydatis]QDT65252.1 hypothetical protein V22_24990 [Calycomorphotria hydatis]